MKGYNGHVLENTSTILHEGDTVKRERVVTETVTKTGNEAKLHALMDHPIIKEINKAMETIQVNVGNNFDSVIQFLEQQSPRQIRDQTNFALKLITSPSELTINDVLPVEEDEQQVYKDVPLDTLKRIYEINNIRLGMLKTEIELKEQEQAHATKDKVKTDDSDTTSDTKDAKKLSSSHVVQTGMMLS